MQRNSAPNGTKSLYEVAGKKYTRSRRAGALACLGCTSISYKVRYAYPHGMIPGVYLHPPLILRGSIPPHSIGVHASGCPVHCLPTIINMIQIPRTHQPTDARRHEAGEGRPEVAFPSAGPRLTHDVVRRFNLHLLRTHKGKRHKSVNVCAPMRTWKRYNLKTNL